MRFVSETYARKFTCGVIDEHARSAYLTSLVTLADRVPLYHTEAAQWGSISCSRIADRDAACHAAYPRFRENFALV